MESKAAARIRVLIADDHAVVRSGLGTFLRSYDDLELVGEASNGHEAVQLCEKLRPDLVLMDLAMPEMNGVEATRHIHRSYPHIHIIALTGIREEEMVKQALEAGAIGYQLKNISADDLVKAIQYAHAGHPTLAPEATEALIHTALHPFPVGHDLTSREREVLTLIVEGCNNREIANRLVVSRSTVKFHVSSILSKLGVTSRTGAVTCALQHHLTGGQLSGDSRRPTIDDRR